MGFGFGQSMNVPGAAGSQGRPMSVSPAQRLQQLEEEYRQFPGAAPGGTGLTGLGKNDAQGYSDMLNRRTEYMALANQAQGGKGINMQFGGVMGSPNALPQATGQNNRDAFGIQDAGVGGGAMQAFRKQFKQPDQYQAALAGLRNSTPYSLG